MGRVLSAHGLEGWVKVAPFTDDLLGICQRWLEQPWDLSFRLTRGNEAWLEARLAAVRPGSRPPLFAFDGLFQREQAKVYGGGQLWLRRCELSPCADGEFFFADLEACRLTLHGQQVAKVVAVLEVGPSVLLEVEHGGRRSLVPFVEHFIGDVDVDNGTIELKHDWILE